MWNYFVFPATTDPGTFYRENPLSVKGTAIMKPGQYRGAYMIGRHRGCEPGSETHLHSRYSRNRISCGVECCERHAAHTEFYYPTIRQNSFPPGSANTVHLNLLSSCLSSTLPPSSSTRASASARSLTPRSR